MEITRSYSLLRAGTFLCTLGFMHSWFYALLVLKINYLEVEKIRPARSE